MTAYSPNRTMIYRMPETASFRGSEQHSLLSRLAAGLSRMRERRAAAAELRNADERDLRDMGINRGDIDRLFDPAFAQEYAERGQPWVTPRRNAALW